MAMVRKDNTTTSMRLPPQLQGPEVKIPSLFRCQISLDVMCSPVSLRSLISHRSTSVASCSPVAGSAALFAGPSAAALVR
ncbi:U-box domain-containing protein 27-like [Hordeum vulgare]|nr:U-box domain-containing protein 27-like [Hordeum vulgare]